MAQLVKNVPASWHFSWGDADKCPISSTHSLGTLTSNCFWVTEDISPSPASFPFLTHIPTFLPCLLGPPSKKPLIFECLSQRNPNQHRKHLLNLCTHICQYCLKDQPTGALGQPRGMEWGGRREEGSGWGAHVYLWRIHFDIWQNQYNIVKLKNKIKFKK